MEETEGFNIYIYVSNYDILKDFFHFYLSTRS